MQGISGDRVLLPTSVACKVAGLSRRYIQLLARNGRIEGIKLGHDLLVYEDSLNNFIAQRRKRGRPKGSRKQSLSDTKSSPEDSNTPSTNSDIPVQEKKNKEG